MTRATSTVAVGWAIALALPAAVTHAACGENDQTYLAGGGTLATGDPFDTLYKVLECELSTGVVDNPPFELIDPNVVQDGYELTAADPADDMFFRFVPMCLDGSGDHEYTTSNGAAGSPPNCAPREWIRCADGTRPLYYAARAIEPSDRWLFYLTGGGSCSVELGRGGDLGLNPDVHEGEMCHLLYTTGSRADQSSDGVGRSLSRDGILNPDRNDNVFRHYNRVYVEKCAADLWMGDRNPYVTWVDQNDVGAQDNASEDYVLFRNGHRIVKGVFADLKDGVSYESPDGAGGIVITDLPLLSHAEAILLAANSNGAFGLIHTGDRLASFLRDEILAAANEARIRLALDNRLEPSLENEANFNSPALTCGTGSCTLYDQIEAGTSAFGVIGAYDPAQYRRGGREYERLAAWSDRRLMSPDRSCFRAHPDGGRWRCFDFVHILANHLKTPFFIHHSLNDSVLDTHGIEWSSSPLASDWSAAEVEPRMLYQLESLIDEREARGDEGLVNSFWSMAAFAPLERKHVAILDDYDFMDVCLQEDASAAEFTYVKALNQWMLDDDPAGRDGTPDPRAFDLLEGSSTHPAIACTENCASGVDEDGDGLVDCDDPACSQDPACP